MTTEYKYDVFISYSRKDYVDEKKCIIPNNIVSQIKAALDENKISYWMDEKGIYSGEEFAKIIARYIRLSYIFLFISTENSNASEWTSDEIATARIYKKKIIPFKYDDSIYNEQVIIFIAKLDYIDYASNPNQAIEKLIRSIKKYLSDLEDEKKREAERKKREAEEAKKAMVREEIKTEAQECQHLINQQQSIIKKLLNKNEYIGNTSKECPVCKKTNPIATSFCDRCGFQFPALYGIDGNDKYPFDKQQLTIAKANYDAIARIGNEKMQQDQETTAPNKETNTSHAQPTVTGECFTVEMDGLSFNMIRVEEGSLMIGATPEQGEYVQSNEYPCRIVSLPTYYIGQFLVTQNLWETVMGYDNSFFRNGNPHMPAESFTYQEARKFVNQLSKKTGLHFSIPTEEEWEYAARGGLKSQGFRFAGSDDVDEVAWYCDNSGNTTHPVGQKKPNELGIYDMSGNVWEWVETPASQNHSESSPKYNRRGGSWWREANDCRVARRYGLDQSKKTSGLGLRLVIRENIK